MVCEDQWTDLLKINPNCMTLLKIKYSTFVVGRRTFIRKQAVLNTDQRTVNVYSFIWITYAV